MRQILQNLGSGETWLAEVPCPTASGAKVLVRSTRSLVSAGTERMLVEFGRASLIEKARKQPQRVKQVLQKVATDGLFTTVDAVRSKLDQPIPLGYCNVGVVLEPSDDLRPGDRVASTGPHAEVVSVPRRSCVRIPDGVDDETASFAVPGSIALQGIRLAAPTLGETFVVTGLGLLGLLAAQLLSAQGCRVLGLDLSAERVKLAQALGIEAIDLSSGADAVEAARAFSRGRGVDGVLLTVATQQSGPVLDAARMCRKRGRIVLVGVAGLELDRSLFYDKELSFQVSCSYGPGRHDPVYEDQGVDYPVGFVRWTIERNLEAVLDMFAAGRVNVEPLVTHRFDVERATDAYDVLAGGGSSLGIVLRYPDAKSRPDAELKARTVELTTPTRTRATNRGPAIALFGAGNFASRVMLPNLSKLDVRLRALVTRGSPASAHHASKFGVELCTTDGEAVLRDEAVDAVIIATRHDSHAELALQALRAGKHVFVEKPLALSHESLDEIAACLGDKSDRLLTVGFNRRLAPHTVRAHELLDGLTEPRSILITVNAGAIPRNHWVHDPVAGGGRLLGEGCHFIDLARHLAGAPIESVQAMCAGPEGARVDDVALVNLRFQDGSVANIQYLANGHRGLAKERVEVWCGGKVLQIDNFRRMETHGFPSSRVANPWSQDKGHAAFVAAFVEAVRTGSAPPIDYDEIFDVHRATLDAAAQLTR